MVLSAIAKEKLLDIRKIVLRSAGTIGIVLAIATASQANEPPASSPIQTDATATERGAIEREAAADRVGLEKLRARLLSPRPTAEVALPLASSTYLYGQQPIANQPDTAYFVFESQGAQITGALYMPSSSFDCVQGQIIDRQMALSITDSYTKETYSYALILNDPWVEVASQTSNVTPPPSIQGFYPLPIQAQDRAILTTCQAT